MIRVDVARAYPAFRVETAFEADSEGITALFGRSGAGKTSLVNMLAGLLRPDRGRIELDGTVLFDSAKGIDLPPERRRLGYVFQESRLFPHMSVRANLTYGMRRTPPAQRRIGPDEVVEVLGIGHLLDRRPRQLSGGERQRVALGRALLASPRLLLMDEPLASLDAARKAEILPFIERMRDAFAVPVVYVTHAMDEIVRLADTLVLLDEGRVAAVGPVEDLTSRLDLRPLTGRYEAGSVIATTVEGHDETWGLTRLAFPGGALSVPRLDAEPGAGVRVRIRARDVSLAVGPVGRISDLNVLPGMVMEIASPAEGQRQSDVDIRVDIGVPLWVRIARRSLEALEIAPGAAVNALVKGTSIDRLSLVRRKLDGRSAMGDEGPEQTNADPSGSPP
jgi:molybdate transport system ATP-binding protein